MASKKISALTAKASLLAADYLPVIDSTDTSNKRATLVDVQRSLYQGSLKFVVTRSDLPSAVGGVITLADNATYFITGAIDLTGDRIVSGRNTTLLGGSSENCSLSSTGLSASAALISSQWSLPIRNITITHGTAVALNANGNANQAIDWFGVNFTNCPTVGVIANYSNFIMTDCAFLNSAGLTFEGTVGTIGFTQTIFSTAAGGTSIIIPATATITRRFRIIYSAFVTLSGSTSLDISTSASIPVEGYILDTVNFSGGGTYTAGVPFSDNKALFLNCRGVTNTSTVANYYMFNNATVTDIVSTGVPVKIAGTTAAGILSKFSHANNRATYTGALSQGFMITVTCSLTSGNNNQVGLYIAKNGTIVPESEVYSTASGSGRAENITVQAVTNMDTNDFTEVWVENSTATNDVTVQYLNVIVTSI